MPAQERPIEWVGSSYRDLMALPIDVRCFFGYALSLAQAGDRHDAAKVLKGFGGTWRAVYTVRFPEAVFVLHCFQKKSHRGIATPQEDMAVIRARLAVAAAFAKELQDGKKNR